MAHTFVNPDGLAPPVGYSHLAVAERGRLVLLAGETAHGADGGLEGATVAEQFAAAVRNVGRALAAAGAAPEHVVRLTIYVTDVGAYREQLGAIGAAYRAVFADHYPPMALLGVTELLDPAARVELVATAVIPEGPWR